MTTRQTPDRFDALLNVLERIATALDYANDIQLTGLEEWQLELLPAEMDRTRIDAARARAREDLINSLPKEK